MRHDNGENMASKHRVQFTELSRTFTLFLLYVFKSLTNPLQEPQTSKF